MTAPQHPPTPRLRIVTREVDALQDVLSYTSPSHPTYWNRRGDVMAALGETASFVQHGSVSRDGFGAWWRALAANAEIDDPVGLPGTGLIAFGAFAFDPESSARSILSVPWVVVGRRGGRSWVTRITHADDRASTTPPPAASPSAPSTDRTGRRRSAPVRSIPAAIRPPCAEGSTPSPRAK